MSASDDYLRGRRDATDEALELMRGDADYILAGQLRKRSAGEEG